MHYLRFEILDEGELLSLDASESGGLFTRLCKDCFPKRLSMEETSSSDSNSSEDCD